MVCILKNLFANPEAAQLSRQAFCRLFLFLGGWFVYIVQVSEQKCLNKTKDLFIVYVGARLYSHVQSWCVYSMCTKM